MPRVGGNRKLSPRTVPLEPFSLDSVIIHLFLLHVLPPRSSSYAGLNISVLAHGYLCDTQ
jgi:hypothetical protein